MAYFQAVLVRKGTEWQAPDVDLSEVSDLDTVTDLLHRVGAEAGPTLLLIEQEDEWFGIVRVDDDEDPRVFVSDAGAAQTSPKAQLLGIETLGEELADEPLGDFDLLADLGTSPGTLQALCDGRRALTEDDALALIADAAGFDEILTAMR